MCGKPEYLDPEATIPSLTNPRVVIEILSELTADYDHMSKFVRYRSIETVQEYVLIDSRQLAVAVFSRHEGGWNYTPANAPSDVLTLTNVGVQIVLSELHTGIMDKL